MSKKCCVVGHQFIDRHVVLKQKIPIILEKSGGIYNITDCNVQQYFWVGKEKCEYFYYGKQQLVKYNTIKEVVKVDVDKLLQNIKDFDISLVHFAYIDYLDVDLQRIKLEFPKVLLTIDFGGELTNINHQQIIKNVTTADLCFCNTYGHFVYELQHRALIVHTSMCSSNYVYDKQRNTTQNPPKNYLITTGAGDIFASSIIDTILKEYDNRGVDVGYMIQKEDLILAHLKANTFLDKINEKI